MSQQEASTFLVNQIFCLFFCFVKDLLLFIAFEIALWHSAKCITGEQVGKRREESGV